MTKRKSPDQLTSRRAPEELRIKIAEDILAGRKTVRSAALETGFSPPSVSGWLAAYTRNRAASTPAGQQQARPAAGGDLQAEVVELRRRNAALQRALIVMSERCC